MLCLTASIAGAQTAESPAGGVPDQDQTPAEPPASPEGDTAFAAPAAEEVPDAAAGWGDLAESAEQDAPVFRTKLYGFIDYHAEKVANTPDSVDENGNTVYAENPWELDILNLNVMLQGALYDRYRFFLNLAAPSSGSNVEDLSVLVRNAWVEAPLAGSLMILRAGKLYRRFGLYNEILDATPTFIGIEAPELFDKDHLLLTRTTNLMLHGTLPFEAGVVNYALTTGADERATGALPIGADLNTKLNFGLTLGTSFYHTGGDAVPSMAVGDGSPRGGVVNWMLNDRYAVFGGYAELELQGLILQAEYWRAVHDATRDPEAMAQLGAAGSLNPAQRSRFFEGGDPNAGVRTDADYVIDTAYFRAGYELPIGQLASITPYLQFDYYHNPETVNEKGLGGDNEAGLTDNGEFEKYTIGAVLRPVPQVALKIDGSGHRQDFNGKSEFYPEVRFSLSYLWELAQ